MENVKLSDWFKEMYECEFENVVMGILKLENWDEEIVKDYNNFILEFFKFEGEDRKIELNDLKNDEGILYKKMCEWNENKLVIELGLNMLWYDYSIEDYFRDMFDKNDINSRFKLFSLEEINNVLYKE